MAPFEVTTYHRDGGILTVESPSRRFVLTRNPEFEQFRLNIGGVEWSALEEDIGSEPSCGARLQTQRGLLVIWREEKCQEWRLRMEVDKIPLVAAFHVMSARWLRVVLAPPLILLALLRSPRKVVRGVTGQSTRALRRLMRGEISWIGNLLPQLSWRHLFPFGTPGVIVALAVPYDAQRSPTVLAVARGKPELAAVWDLQIPHDYLSSSGPRDLKATLSLFEAQEEQRLRGEERIGRWRNFWAHFGFAVCVTAVWPAIFAATLGLIFLLPLTLPLLVAHSVVVLVAWCSLPLSLLTASRRES